MGVVAKLYFRYGAMNSGKSTAMLQAAYNYEERGHRVLLTKPTVDTKGDLGILSRLGVRREADFLIGPDSDLYARFEQHRQRTIKRFERDVSCLLVDEAQFLTEAQVDDLLRIAILENIPVLAYGIRTDFQTVAFPGSRRLLEIAHSLEELKTICRCGRKAVFNARKIDGVFVFDGDQVAIDDASMGLSAGVASVSYESLCGACYLQESHGVLNSGRRRWPVDATPAYTDEPDPDFT
jgi:thymidine kinase